MCDAWVLLAFSAGFVLEKSRCVFISHLPSAFPEGMGLHFCCYWKWGYWLANAHWKIMGVDAWFKIGQGKRAFTFLYFRCSNSGTWEQIFVDLENEACCLTLKNKRKRNVFHCGFNPFLLLGKLENFSKTRTDVMPII